MDKDKSGSAAKDEHQEEPQPELDEDLNGDGGEEEKHGDEEGKGEDKGEHHDIGDDIHDLGSEANAGDNQPTSEQDARSVYVKNVDYSSTKEEVTDFFKSCGKINRVTIITDKYTGNPKGFAYIEFADKESVESALFLSESTFKGRTITVIPKRTNVPFRGRGGRGGRRFGGRGGGYFPMRRGFGMFSGRPMRRGFRPY